jgi:hypothetical protein
VNINELEKLAKAALVLDHNESDRWYAADYICEEGAHYIKNANFISACDPQTILAMIELLREIGDEYHKLLKEHHTRWTDAQIEALDKYREMTK